MVMKFIRNETIDEVSVGIYEHEGKEITGPRLVKKMPECSPKELSDAGMITFDEYRKRGRILGLPITQIERMQGGGKLRTNVR